ncbi:MAG: GNAT family N-acetyltransferase [Aldersonia sp.]|nr:GNAT family N-acetyltransferase [Aldersonia sp.]
MNVADIDRVREIEAAAGQTFRTVGMDRIADDAAPSAERLARYVQKQRGWVWAADGEPAAGYLLVDIVDGHAHIEQVSVHPDYAGRRIGAALVEYAVQWGAARSLDVVTLTTYRDVAWNAPYYWRMGFRPVPENRLGAGLRTIRQREIQAGLDEWPRVTMRRCLPRVAS